MTLTNAQPALMAVSLAVIRTLEREFGGGWNGPPSRPATASGVLRAGRPASACRHRAPLKLRGQATAGRSRGRRRHGFAIGPKTDVALAGGRRRRGELGVRCQRQQPRQCGDPRRQGGVGPLAGRELGARGIPNVSAPSGPLMRPPPRDGPALAGAIVAPGRPSSPTSPPARCTIGESAGSGQQVTGQVRWREHAPGGRGRGTRFAGRGQQVLRHGQRRRTPGSAQQPADLEALARASSHDVRPDRQDRARHRRPGHRRPESPGRYRPGRPWSSGTREAVLRSGRQPWRRVFAAATSLIPRPWRPGRPAETAAGASTSW